jgi:hypothetical protein
MQESKYVIVFFNLMNAKNKMTRESVGKVFLMIKIGLCFIGSLVYSLINSWKIGLGFIGSLVYSLIKSWWH